MRTSVAPLASRPLRLPVRLCAAALPALLPVVDVGRGARATAAAAPVALPLGGRLVDGDAAVLPRDGAAEEQRAAGGRHRGGRPQLHGRVGLHHGARVPARARRCV